MGRLRSGARSSRTHSLLAVLLNGLWVALPVVPGLAANPPADNADTELRSALQEACRVGHQGDRPAEIMLRFPTAIQVANEAGDPLLAIAARGGDVGYLLARGANPDLVDGGGNTPLELAIKAGNRPAIAKLQESAGISDLPSFAQLSRIDLALDAYARQSGGGGSPAAIRAFERFRLSEPTPNRHVWNPLVNAMAQAHGDGPSRLAESLRSLCKTRDSDLESQLLGRAPTILAKWLSAEQRRQLALTAIEERNEAMLQLACRSGIEVTPDFSAQIVALRTKSGGMWEEPVSITIIREHLLDQKQLRAMFFEAADESDLLLLELFAKQFDVNMRDEHGRTLLMMAARRLNASAVELLLTRGADTTLVDDHGWDALRWARNAAKSGAVVQALERAAAASPDQ